MTRLIVCCDGTWNTPEQREAGLPAPTNVVKIFNALAKVDAGGVEQRSYYHPGVGTDGNWWNRLAGGGMGDGLDKNVMSAYRWLAGAYRPGDDIYLFGFSRGAYTVRSVGGMIARCGLLDLSAPGLADKAVWKSVQTVFNAYRKRKELSDPALRFFRDVEGKRTEVHFIGVWDTVGALGIPDDLALLNLIDDPAKHEFHDLMLSDIVRHARHAVAIDEHRESFTPTLWANDVEHPDVRQIWFPGVHGDVGGGYARAALSDGALVWMMEEAAAAGLAFRPGIGRQLAPDPRGPMHDSLTGVFRSLKTRPRAVPRIEPEAEPAAFHVSALERHRDPALEQADYWATFGIAPGTSSGCAIFASNPWNATGFYLEGGVEYRFAATGEWVDGDVPCGPDGTGDGTFHLGEIAHMASSLLGEAETLFRKATGNQQADFWWTRRDETMPWFALVGVVANGVLADVRAAPHQTFLIGGGTTFTPAAGGYLYCFANDAWMTYGNNRGSVRLVVSRA